MGLGFRNKGGNKSGFGSPPDYGVDRGRGDGEREGKEVAKEKKG